MRVVLLGPPGAGKGTQARRLADRHGVPQVATGDILREAMASASELGRRAKSYYDRGELVPDEVMLEVVAQRLRQPDAKRGFVLDGFPRTVPQAEGLDRILQEFGCRLDAVLLFEVPQEALVRRLSGRWVCRAQGHVFHEVYSPPQVPGRCDHDGSELYQREDDQPHTVRRRLEVYRQQTAPLVEYYRARGLLHPVDASADPEEVGRRVEAVLQQAGSAVAMAVAGVFVKSPTELERMRRAGRVAALALREVGRAVRPGITTAALDRIARKAIQSLGGVPSFLGYRGFPASACISVNDEIVHGIPGRRALKEGDLVKVDLGALVDGYHGDVAATFPVGSIPARLRRLLQVTEEALFRGIEMIRPGAHLGDVGWAVQSFVESYGYSVVRQFAGHGVGRSLHEDPQVPNFGKPGKGLVLRPGMVIAVEPMVNEGTWRAVVDGDGWTVRTADGKLSAHFEHTVAVTEKGYEILTLLDDGENPW